MIQLYINNTLSIPRLEVNLDIEVPIYRDIILNKYKNKNGKNIIRD